MRNAMRLWLAAALSMAAVVAMAQKESMLHLDDILGVWNLTYEDGQTTGTITISKNADGSPMVKVSTSAGGESEAKEVMIKGDTITFTRDINVQGQSGSVNYMAKLVDGKLEGTGEVNLGGAGGGAGGPGGGGATPFTATRPK